MKGIQNALVGCVFFAALIAVPAHADDCSPVKIAAFDMEQDAQGSIVIPVTPDNIQTYMVLDLAISSNALYSDTVKQLDLSPKKIGNFTAFILDQRVDSFVKLPSIIVGKSSGKGLSFLVLPDRQNADLKIAGLLGLDALGNYDVDLDFPKQKLNLFLPSKCAENQIVYWTSSYQTVPLEIQKQGNFTFPGQLDGADIKWALSANSMGALAMSAANHLFGLTAASPGMVPVGKIGSFMFYRYTFKNLTIGGFPAAETAMGIYDDMTVRACNAAPGCTGMEASGGISLNALKSLHLYISYNSKKMFVSPGA